MKVYIIYLVCLYLFIGVQSISLKKQPLHVKSSNEIIINTENDYPKINEYQQENNQILPGDDEVEIIIKLPHHSHKQELLVEDFTLPWPTNIESDTTLWYVDRRAPAIFENDEYSNRDPVIKIGVDPIDFDPSGTFYNAQGKKIVSAYNTSAVNTTVPIMYCGSIYIPAEWEANAGNDHYNRSDIWLRLINSSGLTECPGDACAVYATIGFTNRNADGSVMYFDPTVGSIVTPVGDLMYYNDWNQACGVWSEGTLRYFWNGEQIAEINGISSGSQGYIPDTISEYFIQARNTNSTTTAYWSEASTGRASIANDILLLTYVVEEEETSVEYDIIAMVNGTVVSNGININGFVHNWGTLKTSAESDPFKSLNITMGYRAFTNNSNVARMIFNVELGDSTSPTDTITINNVISGGQTLVTVNNIGGLGDQTTGSGILLIDASGVLHDISCESFVLDVESIVVDDFTYTLVCNQSEKKWFLQSTSEEQPPCIPCIPICPAAAAAQKRHENKQLKELKKMLRASVSGHVMPSEAKLAY